MKSSVIIFPGSNCDRDMDVALNKFGFKNTMVWHNDSLIPKCDLIVLPGGFSYGDYLRCGSIASKSKIIKSVIEFANSGGLVLGICNGFQILTETGLLPGILQQNKYLNFICKNVFVKIKDKKNKYFNSINKDILELHIAHNEGNYFCTKEELKSRFISFAPFSKFNLEIDKYSPGSIGKWLGYRIVDSYMKNNSIEVSQLPVKDFYEIFSMSNYKPKK